MKLIKVLCVDDNELIADAVRIKLRLAGGFEWAGRLQDASRLVEDVREHRPDVVLLDIDMPGTEPFVALERVSREFPETRVLMFSGHVRPELVDRAVEAGAWGYISKNEETEAIVAAIRQVASGEFVLSTDVEHDYRRL